jgi:EpsI family protein
MKPPVVQTEESYGLGAFMLSPASYLRIALILAGYFLFYGSALPELVYDWFNYYGPFSYCAVIPLMSLYVVWRERHTLAKIPAQPALLGFVFVMCAVAIGVIGKAVGDSFAIRVSMVLTTAGLVYLILGKELFKALLFPIGFLFLMIPWPYVLVKEVAYRLRIIDAVLAEGALRALGVIVYRDSYFLHLPNITLEVADLCSGISSVFALFALGSYYAYFLPLRPWMKLLVVASTVPFAALINLLRIILTSVLAYYVGPVALNYLVHELTGIITFFIALALFIGLGEFLQRRVLRGERPVSSEQVADVNGVSESVSFSGRAKVSGSRSWLAFSAGCFMLFLGVYLSFRLDAVHPLPLARELKSVPDQVGEYSTGKGIGSEAYRDANAEQELSRYYAKGASETFEVYVGYRSYQRGDKRLSSPKLIMVPHWNFVSLDPAQISIVGAGPIDGVWMTLQKDTAKQLVLYWYQDRGETFAGEVAYRFHQAKKMILDSRTEGAIVRIATPLLDGENAQQARERISRFVPSFYPNLAKILPQ